MKFNRKIIYIIMIFYLVLHASFNGMASQPNLEIGKEEEYLLSFLEALKSRDEIAARNLFSETYKMNDKESFEKMMDLWDAREVTSCVKKSEEARQQTDTHLEDVLYQYQVYSGTESIEVNFSLCDYGEEGIKLDSFHFVVETEAIGGISSWKQFNMWQWIMAGLAVCEIIFTIYTAVLCIKRKEKYYIIWCIAILSIYGGITFNNLQGLYVGAFINLFRTPRMTIYPFAGFIIHFSVPIAAIVYFIRSNKLAGLKNGEEGKIADLSPESENQIT